MIAAAAPRRALRVAVACEHGLVAQSVAAALAGRGYDVGVVSRPGVSGPARGGSTARAPGSVVAGPPGPTVGVLLSDLDRPGRIRAARELIGTVEVPWVVLTGIAEGPAWGAVLDAGAVRVLPTATTLDELVVVVDEVVADRPGPAALPGDDVAGLVARWREEEDRRRVVEDAVAALTPRERDVLRLLHDGRIVREIAEEHETSEATVRSQVKSVLRKLRVSTQVAAAATYEEALTTWSADSTSSASSRR